MHLLAMLLLVHLFFLNNSKSYIVFIIHIEMNLILMMSLRKPRKNQRKVNYRFTLIASVTVLLLIKY